MRLSHFLPLFVVALVSAEIVDVNEHDLDEIDRKFGLLRNEKFKPNTQHAYFSKHMP